MHPWQMQLVEYLQGPPIARKIRWYVDHQGGTGKSSFAKHMARHGAFYTRGGKTADVAFAFFEHLNNNPATNICIFDFTRSGKDFVNYDVLEQVKDGLIVSPKYESRTIVCPVQHCIVFANWAPDEEKLSADRWDIIRIYHNQNYVNMNVTQEAPEPFVIPENLTATVDELFADL
ncbi:Rep [Pittosporum tobira CRESS virus]|nr:Rep [Pittosporum tobira CRESS virus]